MCLGRSAHGLVPNHPIFRGPLPVDIQYAKAPTPESYAHYVSGADLPAELDVWHVDQADYKTDKSLQPGTVSNGYGFADSPDAEVIAGGLNSKACNSVALGRHGALFLWGFASAPSGMTASGRNAFVNATCYIQKFDHQPLQVRNAARDRGWALESAHSTKDAAKLASVRADLEFVRRGEKRDFLIDEDCKALGISNRRLALLEACIGNLETGTDQERSARLLARYTDQSFATAAEWRRWFAASKPRLFFSDVGGYRWFEAIDQDAELRRRAAAEPCVPATAEQAVVTTVTPFPTAAQPGEVVTLAVRLHIAEGFHAYGDLPTDSAYQPVTLAPELPAGWSTVGRTSLPASQDHASERGVRVFTGDPVFLLRVRAASNATPGAMTVPVKVAFMVCDEMRCLPPDEVMVAATVQVLGSKSR